MQTTHMAEFIGTALLVLLGNGVVANVVLPKTKGNGGGWIVITFGWGMAVFVAVWCVGGISGAHINPAVTVGLALAGKFAWADVGGFIVAQMLGGIVGAALVFLYYMPHYAVADDADAKLATFCTAPAIRNTPSNFISEAIGTMLLVLAIGLSLGGTTGYAINPARDLGPRIAHTLLPVPGKRDSDWGYAWIPVVGPLVGASLAVLVWKLLAASPPA